jgi:hypothetical protein
MEIVEALNLTYLGAYGVRKTGPSGDCTRERRCEVNMQIIVEISKEKIKVYRRMNKSYMPYDMC